MQKKIICFLFLLISLTLLVNFRFYNNELVLNNVGYGYKCYATASSSYIEEISKFNGFKNVKSESCKLSLTSYNEKKFLSDMDAKEIFKEEIESGTIIYAYSPRIKNCENVKNKLINLQIFVGKNYVKIGTPLIYEGF